MSVIMKMTPSYILYIHMDYSSVISELFAHSISGDIWVCFPLSEKAICCHAFLDSLQSNCLETKQSCTLSLLYLGLFR